MKFVAAVLFFVLSTAALHADEHARARAAFRAGSQHYNLGEFQQALESFREAYRDYEDASFLFNIAQCERQLGHKRDAVREYRAYLNNAPADTANRDETREIIVRLEKEIAEEEQASKAPKPAPLVVPSTPAAAPVLVPPPPESAAALTRRPIHDRTPVYKRWWVWTLVGGAVVAAGAAAGLAVALSHSDAPSATTTLGTKSPF